MSAPDDYLEKVYAGLLGKAIGIYLGHPFELWSSTPAVLWTANRPQEKGIHVHVYEKGRRIIDDTFGTVILKGQQLDRQLMWRNMVENTLY